MLGELRLYLAYIRFLAKTKEVQVRICYLTCLSQYPSNSWLILQSVEALISVDSILVIDILTKFYSASNIVDERRWRFIFKFSVLIF